MAQPLRIEVIDITSIASVESLAAQRSLFTHIDAFYRSVGGPGREGQAETLESWVGALVDFVREGGSVETGSARPLEKFYAALVNYLAAQERCASPLPISNVTLRIETMSSTGTMPKEISGNSPFFVSLLTGNAETKNAVITGNFGKAKRVVNAAGKPCKRAEVSAWVYSKFVSGLSVGKVWSAEAP